MLYSVQCFLKVTMIISSPWHFNGRKLWMETLSLDSDFSASFWWVDIICPLFRGVFDNIFHFCRRGRCGKTSSRKQKTVVVFYYRSPFFFYLFLESFVYTDRSCNLSYFIMYFIEWSVVPGLNDNRVYPF